MRKTIALLPVLLTALLVPFSVSPAAAGTSGEGHPVGACADASGVTVAVDLTEVGGDVEVGCAPGDPTTGRQALIDAGFSLTDDPSGMICAINAAPDPCPKTFEGSYWSYWSAEPGAGWTAYEVGADASDPEPGAFEGWRYNDGSSGPSVLPAALQAATGPTEQPTAQAAGPASPQADDGPAPATIAGIGVLALLLAAAVVVARRRRAAGTDRD